MKTLRHFIRTPIPSSGVNISCRIEAHRGLLARYSMLNQVYENHSQHANGQMVASAPMDAFESWEAYRKTQVENEDMLVDESLRYPKVSQ